MAGSRCRQTFGADNAQQLSDQIESSSYSGAIKIFLKCNNLQTHHVSIYSPRLVGQAVAGYAQEVYPTREGEDEVAELKIQSTILPEELT